MTQVTSYTQCRKSEKNGQSSDDCWKLTGTWRDVVVRSRHVWAAATGKARSRQSTTVYDGRSVMMMRLSADDLEPRGPQAYEKLFGEGTMAW